MSRTLERQLYGSREPLSCARCIQPSCPARSIARSRALNPRAYSIRTQLHCFLDSIPRRKVRVPRPARPFSRFGLLSDPAARGRDVQACCKSAVRSALAQKWERSLQSQSRLQTSRSPSPGYWPRVRSARDSPRATNSGGQRTTWCQTMRN